MRLDSAIARIIREAREAESLTQTDLAYLTGLDPMTISRIERGVRLPSVVSVFLIARALRLPTEELIRRIEGLSPEVALQEEPQQYLRKKGRRRQKPSDDE